VEFTKKKQVPGKTPKKENGELFAFLHREISQSRVILDV